MNFAKRSLISMSDLTKEEILFLLQRASLFKKKPPKKFLEGKMLASCFFEPSTRTRLSFEAAMLRLGGSVIGFSEGSATSAKKGESLCDMMRVIGSYSDLIVIRHPLEGAARLASDATSTPIVNGGDGANQHPTQTLTDLFTMQECQGTLQDLKVALVGDLKYGRTIHSLAPVCGMFGIRLYLISPETLSMPDHVLHEMRKTGVKFSFHKTPEEVIDKIDILYLTRIQKERFDHSFTPYILKEELLKKAKPTLKILHPLPRVDEMGKEIDKTPYAYYFQQAENGLFVREALIAAILGEKI